MSASGVKPEPALITTLKALRDKSKVLLDNKEINDAVTRQTAQALNQLAITLIQVKNDNSINLTEAKTIKYNLLLMHPDNMVPVIYNAEINDLSKLFQKALQMIHDDPKAFSFINIVIDKLFGISAQGKKVVGTMIAKLTTNISTYEKLRDFLSSTVKMGFVGHERSPEKSDLKAADLNKTPKPQPPAPSIPAVPDNQSIKPAPGLSLNK